MFFPFLVTIPNRHLQRQLILILSSWQVANGLAIAGILLNLALFEIILELSLLAPFKILVAGAQSKLEQNLAVGHILVMSIVFGLVMILISYASYQGFWWYWDIKGISYQKDLAGPIFWLLLLVPLRLVSSGLSACLHGLEKGFVAAVIDLTATFVFFTGSCLAFHWRLLNIENLFLILCMTGFFRLCCQGFFIRDYVKWSCFKWDSTLVRKELGVIALEISRRIPGRLLIVFLIALFSKHTHSVAIIGFIAVLSEFRLFFSAPFLALQRGLSVYLTKQSSFSRKVFSYHIFKLLSIFAPITILVSVICYFFDKPLGVLLYDLDSLLLSGWHHFLAVFIFVSVFRLADFMIRSLFVVNKKWGPMVWAELFGLVLTAPLFYVFKDASVPIIGSLYAMSMGLGFFLLWPFYLKQN